MSDEPVWTDKLLEAPHEAADKAARVRRMFNAIAPRYELVNTLFSGGRDAFWRRKAVELAGVRADDQVLEIACGTGDFARAFLRAGPRSVVGCDFAHEMLIRAAGGGRRGTSARARVDDPSRRPCGSKWVEADALRLPFREGRFSIASCAFGVRNFGDLDAGLAEMHRVLRPGGRAVVLEFTRPTNVAVRRLYEFFSSRVMPVAATWVSGDTSGAYRYFPRSVVSFLDAAQLCDHLRAAGFLRTTAIPLTMGVVTVCVATRD
jgi:demethylmenaquinone methyltransferase/2-methoxy-6-polyprenyl-1,4-benzoquinol methylase